jgi:DNA-directed RNA polymerase specialized sigma subunit
MKQIAITLGADESHVSQIVMAALAKLQVRLTPQSRKGE